MSNVQSINQPINQSIKALFSICTFTLFYVAKINDNKKDSDSDYCDFVVLTKQHNKNEIMFLQDQ